jgi:transcriptional regulator with XRE-family HTH domain
MGKTLKKLATRKKLSQAALAKRAGLSREYVNARGLAMSDSLPVPTAEHITEVLRRVGALKDNGAVSHVTVEMSRATLISSIGRLRLTYTGQSVEAPSHVFLKTRRHDLDASLDEGARREADFYAIVASATPPGILPRCYEAFTAADGAWRLLLEDLTATHEALGDWPIPSTVEQSDRIIDAHARFHAHWWDAARLGESVGAFLDTSGALNRHLASFAKDFSTFVDRLGDRLSPEHKALYERLLAAAPRLLARYSSHRNLTIVHGDAHVWNVMMPRDPGQVGLRLIDWDGWRVDQATDDLAYMIALFWPAERRRRLERRALERYHATLLAHGVGGYGFDALWQDYRYSVLWQCATPVWQAAHKLGPWIWWPNLERVMVAIDDLGCRDLIA